MADVSVQEARPPLDVVILTREQAESICEVLIEMAVRLPMKHRNHAEALDLLRPPILKVERTR